ncbi:hypothetical protein CC117_01680 [Parafrankia colletiae]|uniref:Integral membrane protein n=1 Tax=Parafrankia colletiae TaxID=573497 RepID=A0A1S1RLV1_9ACTN|nr:hypothetical protein [Parafrankia colletiae]MCK9899016.1 hypothetical protein [Frankia sp. Cpl3]OHV46375.1 hypothetical protein CC117_01680 [Parafrankia colletiae]
MTTFLLSAHVVVAIIAIGPVTVAASMFAPAVRAALRDPDDARAAGVVSTLHRICNVYAAIGITVPILGFATAASMGVLGDPWLLTSIALTGVAAGVLALAVLPGQQQLLDVIDTRAAAVSARNVAVASGLFSLLWTVVTVLMIVRPGSTTGV